MPTAARLKLEFEEGPCPHCGAGLQLEFGKPHDPRPRDSVESGSCTECGGEIVAEARGIRFWYTPEEFANKDTPARRLIRSSRQWFALAVEMRLAAAQVMGAEQEDLTDEFERTEAALRKALARALDKARDEVTRR